MIGLASACARQCASPSSALLALYASRSSGENSSVGERLLSCEIVGLPCFFISSLDCTVCLEREWRISSSSVVKGMLLLFLGWKAGRLEGGGLLLSCGVGSDYLETATPSQPNLFKFSLNLRNNGTNLKRVLRKGEGEGYEEKRGVAP